MTTALDGHIEVDETGVARVAGTRLKVIHLVMDKMAHGSTPEQMRQQFPPLSLSQIHAALTYYYDHKAELDAQIQQGLREAEALRAQAQDQPGREQLLERRRGSAGGGGS
jgi:uncharacterized protein (DUF433 family)